MTVNKCSKDQFDEKPNCRAKIAYDVARYLNIRHRILISRRYVPCEDKYVFLYLLIPQDDCRHNFVKPMSSRIAQLCRMSGIYTSRLATKVGNCDVGWSTNLGGQPQQLQLAHVFSAFDLSTILAPSLDRRETTVDQVARGGVVLSFRWGVLEVTGNVHGLTFVGVAKCF